MLQTSPPNNPPPKPFIPFQKRWIPGWEAQHPEPYQPSLPAQQELPLLPREARPPQSLPQGWERPRGCRAQRAGPGGAWRCSWRRQQAGTCLPRQHSELQRCPCHHQSQEYLSILQSFCASSSAQDARRTRYTSQLHAEHVAYRQKNIFPFFQVCCKTTDLTRLSRKSRALGSSQQHGCLQAPSSSTERPGVNRTSSSGFQGNK